MFSFFYMTGIDSLLRMLGKCIPQSGQEKMVMNLFLWLNSNDGGSFFYITSIFVFSSLSALFLAPIIPTAYMSFFPHLDFTC